MGVKNVDSPCLQCNGRTVGCHGRCESYKEYLVKHQEYLDTIRKNENDYQSVYQYREDKVRRLRKGRRKGGRNE